MSFAENLQRARREKHLSQEELAEMLDVSRQAVSKWEQGTGYPEVDKLRLLAQKLNLSLDRLLETAFARETANEPDRAAGTITLSSPHEHVVVRCDKVMSSPRFKGRKDAPRYALFAASGGSGSFWGTSSTFLGWYACEKQLEREMTAIREALSRGAPFYELQYNVRVERKRFGLKIVRE